MVEFLLLLLLLLAFDEPEFLLLMVEDAVELLLLPLVLLLASCCGRTGLFFNTDNSCEMFPHIVDSSSKNQSPSRDVRCISRSAATVKENNLLFFLFVNIICNKPVLSHELKN